MHSGKPHAPVAPSAFAPPGAVGGGREFFTYATFPVIMFGAIAAGTAMLASGADPKLVNPVIATPAVMMIALMERLHPHARNWNEPKGDLKADICYFFTTSATVFVTLAFLGATLIPLAGWLSARSPFFVWPNHWPILVQLVLALAVGEFGNYWAHRLMHETKLLWRIHALHHSAPRLYWLNASRFHPLDMMLSTVLGFGPLVLLGCGEPAVAMFTLVGTIHSFFQHANIRMRLGPLNYLFSMAELHRWHHSKTLKEANANYGGHLILWDLVFGTRFLPADREPPEEIGILDPPNFPTDLSKQLISPFIFDEFRSSDA
jgi:sterol desaturase/sphingolipid hydroxylase (fatty acid hydroxylase superfamily)